MNSFSSASAARITLATSRTPRRFLRAALPALSLALVILGIAWLNPRAISYFGLNLMLNLEIPVALVTIAQMFVITVNDLDLSIGTSVSFVGCVTATWLRDDPLLGIVILLGCVGVYALIGAVIYLRNVPSIVEHRNKFEEVTSTVKGFSLVSEAEPGAIREQNRSFQEMADHIINI